MVYDRRVRNDIRKIVLEWGRAHDLLDKLGVPNDAPLAERFRRLLIHMMPGWVQKQIERAAERKKKAPKPKAPKPKKPRS